MPRRTSVLPPDACHGGTSDTGRCHRPSIDAGWCPRISIDTVAGRTGIRCRSRPRGTPLRGGGCTPGRIAWRRCCRRHGGRHRLGWHAGAGAACGPVPGCGVAVGCDRRSDLPSGPAGGDGGSARSYPHTGGELRRAGTACPGVRSPAPRYRRKPTGPGPAMSATGRCCSDTSPGLDGGCRCPARLVFVRADGRRTAPPVVIGPGGPRLDSSDVGGEFRLVVECGCSRQRRPRGRAVSA